jgi:hypothetical protein
VNKHPTGRKAAKELEPIVRTCIDPSRKDVYGAAKAYVESGLSLIPIRADGTKRPAFELLPEVWCEKDSRYRRPWSGYKERRPMVDEIRKWFLGGAGNEYGLAVLGGKVSGGLEIIDFDTIDLAEPWAEQVRQFAPGVLERLVCVRTPRPGMHVYYRCPVFGGSQKLARVPETDAKTEKLKPKTVIELKGEAGYCLAPPSPAACHPSRRSYTFLDGKDLTMVPTITEQERQMLLGCARMFNSWERPKRPHRFRRGRPGGSGRPGDDFNDRADWGEILEPHGWTWVGSGGDGSDRWCRPGKAGGTSASTNFDGSDLLYVFSTNADPLEDGTGYTKFHAYTLLEHGGDFTAAARALAARGYGGHGRRSRGRSADPFGRYAGYATRSVRPRAT